MGLYEHTVDRNRHVCDWILGGNGFVISIDLFIFFSLCLTIVAFIMLLSINNVCRWLIASFPAMNIR